MTRTARSCVRTNGRAEPFGQDAGPHVTVLGHQDVVERAQAAEELHVLERARDAQPGDLIGPASA